MKKLFVAIMLAALVSACASQPVESSRQMLWEKFGNQPLDNLLTAWGPPMGETHLTTGTRLVSYSYADIYELNTWDQNTYSCKAVFTAPPPSFKITNITMEGDDDECHELALGHTGISSAVSPAVSLFHGRFRDD